MAVRLVGQSFRKLARKDTVRFALLIHLYTLLPVMQRPPNTGFPIYDSFAKFRGITQYHGPDQDTSKTAPSRNEEIWPKITRTRLYFVDWRVICLGPSPSGHIKSLCATIRTPVMRSRNGISGCGHDGLCSIGQPISTEPNRAKLGCLLSQGSPRLHRQRPVRLHPLRECTGSTTARALP